MQTNPRARNLIEQIEKYFAKIDLPKEIIPNNYSVIYDVPLYVNTSIAAMKHTRFESAAFNAAYHRLRELKAHFEKTKTNE